MRSSFYQGPMPQPESLVRLKQSMVEQYPPSMYGDLLVVEVVRPVNRDVPGVTVLCSVISDYRFVDKVTDLEGY